MQLFLNVHKNRCVSLNILGIALACRDWNNASQPLYLHNQKRESLFRTESLDIWKIRCSLLTLASARNVGCLRDGSCDSTEVWNQMVLIPVYQPSFLLKVANLQQSLQTTSVRAVIVQKDRFLAFPTSVFSLLLQALLFLFVFFLLSSLYQVITFDLPSSSLIVFQASSDLMVNPSTEFYIPVLVFFQLQSFYLVLFFYFCFLY